MILLLKVKGKNFCVIQVHSKKGTGYEAVLRVGKLPDTGTNGDVVRYFSCAVTAIYIIRFPIGNTDFAEKLIGQMKTLYEREGFGTLIYDSKNDSVSSSQQASHLPPAYGFAQNPFASQSQQSLSASAQNAPPNPAVPTMMQNQSQAIAGFSQPVNIPTSNNSPFVQLQGSSSVGFLPPNVGISTVSNIGNVSSNVGQFQLLGQFIAIPIYVLGTGASSANAFSQMALAQKFGV